MSRFFDFTPTFFAFFLEIETFFCDLTRFEPKPAKIPARLEPIADIRVILWDIYGTLCGAKVGDLQDSLAHRNMHLAPAQGVIEKFSLGDSLKNLGGSCDQSSPEILVDLYHDQIAQSHRRSEELGIEYPEVEIDKIWQQILERCRDAGYQLPLDSLAYKIAYYYDCAFQNMMLYPKIADCLDTLKERGLIQGIISNAQFYTPLRLQRLLRGDLADFFTEELVFFSYELGCSKPNPLAFRRAIDALKPYDVSPEQVLFIGNDMLNDMAAAQEHGFKTMLFAADETQTKLREGVDRCRNVRPDAIVTHANQIAGLVIDN